MIRFHIFSRMTLRGWRWYFNATAANGEKILQSEGYRNRADAVDTLDLIRRKASRAPIVEVPR